MHVHTLGHDRIQAAESPALLRAHVDIDEAPQPAGLVDDLIVQRTGMHRIDAQPHWLSDDHPAGDPLLRSYRVVDELPAASKELRRALRGRGIGSATVKTRGGRRDAERIRAELRLDGDGADAVIVATDVAGRPAVYLVDSP